MFRRYIHLGYSQFKELYIKDKLVHCIWSNSQPFCFCLRAKWDQTVELNLLNPQDKPTNTLALTSKFTSPQQLQARHGPSNFITVSRFGPRIENLG